MLLIWYMYASLLFYALYIVLAISTVGLALVFSLLLFTLWFFTGYYYIFVILFGLTMGSLVSATVLFTPLGKNILATMENALYKLIQDPE